MSRTKTIDTLKSWPQAIINNLVHALNTQRIASDEDDLRLSSGMIEGWTEECDEFLRQNGYLGGRLKTGGGFFPGVGAIYIIYDERDLTYEESQKHLDTLAKNVVLT